MKYIIALIIVALLAWGGYYMYSHRDEGDTSTATTTTNQIQNNNDVVNASTTDNTEATSTEPLTEESIGKSVDGADIMAYHYGTGAKEILFIGGIHGGYSPNTVAVANSLREYLAANPTVIPADVKVTVIPVMNPDGLKQVSANSTDAEKIASRFNANKVDLNRNFDCEWKAEGVWQNRPVSGGSKPFSEPEAAAIKNYIDNHEIKASVVWYSAFGGVFASNCHGGVTPETKDLLNVYAKAAGYSADDEFDFYAITGDMTNWFAKENIPTVSVLLTNHTDPEWSKNQKGIEATLNWVAALN